MMLHQPSNIVYLQLQQLSGESQNLPQQKKKKKEIAWHFSDLIVCEIFA